MKSIINKNCDFWLEYFGSDDDTAMQFHVVSLVTSFLLAPIEILIALVWAPPALWRWCKYMVKK